MTTHRTRDDSGERDLLTLDEFMRLPEEEAYRIELVRGRVVREPQPQPLHARVLTRFAALLDAWAEATGAGAVLTDGGFLLQADPPTVRGPDLAFVSRDRIPEHAYEERGFWSLAPDLAVEIVSPSNTAGEIQEKVLEYLDAGARLVWVVHPESRRVTVYRSRTEIRILGADEDLDGGEILPGFRVPMGEVFRL